MRNERNDYILILYKIPYAFPDRISRLGFFCAKNLAGMVRLLDLVCDLLCRCQFHCF